MPVGNGYVSERGFFGTDVRLGQIMHGAPFAEPPPLWDNLLMLLFHVSVRKRCCCGRNRPLQGWSWSNQGNTIFAAEWHDTRNAPCDPHYFTNMKQPDLVGVSLCLEYAMLLFTLAKSRHHTCLRNGLCEPRCSHTCLNSLRLGSSTDVGCPFAL